jgi:hypothetical protein
VSSNSPALSTPNAVTSLFSRFLIARADADGGHELWSLHSLDAWLMVEGQPIKRADTDAEALSASHRLALAGLRKISSGFPDGSPATPLAWQQAAATPASGVAFFGLQDAWRDTPLEVALGVVEEDGQWRIAFMALVDGDREGGFERWAAGALAEFPFVAGQQSVINRDWLDLAYRRRFRKGRPPLLVPPGLRFTCQGTSRCCVHFEIPLQPVAQAFVDALPASVFGAGPIDRHLEPREDGLVLLKRENTRCRFLDEANRCRIHALLGTPVFPDCVAYPFHFTQTSEGVAVGASLQCPTVRSNVGAITQDQVEDLYDRLSHMGATPMPAVLAIGADHPVEAADYEAAHADVAAALALDVRTDLRLWAALKALQARREGQAPDFVAALQAPIPPLPTGHRVDSEHPLTWLLGVLAAGRPKLGLGDNPPLPVAAALADERQFAAWLALVHQTRVYAYTFDLAAATNVLVVMYALGLALEAAHGRDKVPEGSWNALGGAVSHLSIARLLASVYADGEKRTELGNPALGLEFLRALVTPAR